MRHAVLLLQPCKFSLYFGIVWVLWMHAVNWGVFTVVCWCERRNSPDLINALEFCCKPKRSWGLCLLIQVGIVVTVAFQISSISQLFEISRFIDGGLSASGQSGSKFCLTTWERQVQILSFRLGWALRQCPLWTFDISSSLVQSYEPDGKLES